MRLGGGARPQAPQMQSRPPVGGSGGRSVFVVRCQLEGVIPGLCVCMCWGVHCVGGGRGGHSPQEVHSSKAFHSLPRSIASRVDEAPTCTSSFHLAVKNPSSRSNKRAFGALWCPQGGSAGTELGAQGGRNNKEPGQSSPSVTRLKHVEDGVVHLDQHSQVDGQAGLAVLRGGRARQPGEGVVLLQYKPEVEK